MHKIIFRCSASEVNCIMWLGSKIPQFSSYMTYEIMLGLRKTSEIVCDKSEKSLAGLDLTYITRYRKSVLVLLTKQGSPF